MIAALFLAVAILTVPDPTVTPGAVNPAVTQTNIAKTICVPGWTKTIRPRASYTNRLKVRQLASGPYMSAAAPRDFEEDHLVSLEIGGHPTDERNLWPQHWAAPMGARQKDQLENYLHRAVCAKTMTLRRAQAAMSSDWTVAYRKYIQP